MDRQVALSILEQVHSEKQASGADISKSLQEMTARGLQHEALNDIGHTAMLGLGAGAVVGGAAGLYNILRRNLQKPAKPLQASVAVPVSEFSKAAEVGGDVVDFLKGNLATAKEGIPWYRPGLVAGGLGGVYGGWKGVEALLNSRRKKDVNTDVEEAKQRFNQAMMSQYGKQACDDSLGEDLDRLYDAMQKQATAGNTMGELAGAYGMYALPAAAIPAYLAYQAGQKRQTSTVLRKALAQRAMRRQAQQPPEIYAMPMPTPGGAGDASDEASA